MFDFIVFINRWQSALRVVICPFFLRSQSGYGSYRNSRGMCRELDGSCQTGGAWNRGCFCQDAFCTVLVEKKIGYKAKIKKKKCEIGGIFYFKRDQEVSVWETQHLWARYKTRPSDSIFCFFLCKLKPALSIFDNKLMAIVPWPCVFEQVSGLI